MRMRVARPTAQLPEVVRFYEEGIGLPRLGAFKDHDGYDGVILGAPDARAQIEFTKRKGAHAPARVPDEHLVLYFDTRQAHASAVTRLRAMGHVETAAHNPWWKRAATTFCDPDGWEVILVPPAKPA